MVVEEMVVIMMVMIRMMGIDNANTAAQMSDFQKSFQLQECRQYDTNYSEDDDGGGGGVVVEVVGGNNDGDDYNAGNNNATITAAPVTTSATAGGGGSFLECEDFWRMFDHLFPACAFFSFSF